MRRYDYLQMSHNIIKESEFPDHPVFVNLRKRIPRDVLATIASCDSRISGSVILQAYYGVDWNSDIDIYECVTRKYAQDAGAGKFSNLENIFHKRLGYATVECAGFDYSDYDPYLRIAQTRSYGELKEGAPKEELWRLARDNYKNIYQVIGVVDCESEEQFRNFLDTVFDFPICKNYIQFAGRGDGTANSDNPSPTVDHDLYGQLVDTSMTLWMHSPEDIKRRKTKLQFGIRPCETMERVEKYRSRGIDVVDDGTAVPPVIHIPAVFVSSTHRDRTYLLPRSPVKLGGMPKGREVPYWQNTKEGYVCKYGIEDPRCEDCKYGIATPHVHVVTQMDYAKMRVIEYVLATTNEPM